MAGIVYYSPKSIFMTPSSPILTPGTPVILTPSSPLTPWSELFSLKLVDTKPNVAVIYESVNNNPHTKYRIVKYFYYKTLDKWLKDELSSILNYFTYHNGKVEMIKNMSEYKEVNTDSEEVMNKKIEYIEKNVLGKYEMAKILLKLVKEDGIMWVDLPRKEFLIKTAVKEWFHRMIRKHLKEGK